MKPAFTLIELLVTIAIISVLIAIVLPVLGQTRQAALNVSCLANLQQMNTGWQSVLQDTDYRIPETYSATVPPGDPNTDLTSRSWDALLETYMGLQKAPGEKVSISCPSAVNVYPDIQSAAGLMTYGVNVRWRPDSAPGDNERQSWDQIISPGTYPFFADTDALTLGNTQIIYDKIGLRNSFDPSPDWQLGFIHLQDTVNVAYADGHVENHNRDVIQGATDSNGIPLYFFNRARAYRLAAAW